MWDKSWHEHLDAVHRFALRLTGDRHAAEDVAQEAMLRGWKARASLPDDRRRRVWLLRIATNVWRDLLRRRGVRFVEETLRHDPAIEAIDEIERAETHRRVLLALEGLPERQRRALHLVAIEGLNHREAAEVLGTTADAIKANVWHARQTLRERLAGETGIGTGQ